MEALSPLAAFRKRQNLSQKALAELLGKNRLTIHRWETGKRRPDPDELPNITKKTGIPARELRPDLAELLGSAA